MWERLQNQTLDQTEVIQACIDDANDEVITRNFSKTKKKKKNMMGLEWSILKNIKFWKVFQYYLFAPRSMIHHVPTCLVGALF
jgi:hypothetical protein